MWSSRHLDAKQLRKGSHTFLHNKVDSKVYSKSNAFLLERNTKPLGHSGSLSINHESYDISIHVKKKKKDSNYEAFYSPEFIKNKQK